jgi:hypothetical protein
MYSKRAKAELKRLDEERHWFQAGYDACGTGLELKDWPRPDYPTKKYSRSWYRIKELWQDGWNSGAGKAISQHSQDEEQLKPKSINDRLYFLLREQSPVPMRKVLQQFSSLDIANVRQLILDWSNQGAIRVTGSGKRGSSVIIEKL